jgi:hypothetical protein
MNFYHSVNWLLKRERAENLLSLARCQLRFPVFLAQVHLYRKTVGMFMHFARKQAKLEDFTLKTLFAIGSSGLRS